MTGRRRENGGYEQRVLQGGPGKEIKKKATHNTLKKGKKL